MPALRRRHCAVRGVGQRVALVALVQRLHMRHSDGLRRALGGRQRHGQRGPAHRQGADQEEQSGRGVRPQAQRVLQALAHKEQTRVRAARRRAALPLGVRAVL